MGDPLRISREITPEKKQKIETLWDLAEPNFK